MRREQPFAAPIIAPLQTLQDRCLAAPVLIAAIIVGKFVDHVPLYRWERIFESRHGVWVPRQTMAGYMGLAADWLRPIYEHIRTGVLGGGYVQIDETPIEYLSPGNGETKLGYLWVCSRPGSASIAAAGPPASDSIPSAASWTCDYRRDCEFCIDNLVGLHGQKL